MPVVSKAAPSMPPADLPVDLRRIELLCARLRAEEGADLERIEWTIAKQPRGEGWDNVLWPVGRLDGRLLVLRAARRKVALGLLEREVTVLRRLRGLGTQLSMSVPTILATADGAVLVPWIDGRTADDVPALVRSSVARDLARMLAAVHSGPAPEVGRNPVRGVPLSTRTEHLAADLERAGLDEDAADRARTCWQAGLDAAPWEGRDLLLHGDPHPGNVVVPAPESSDATTLIDWGDTTRGDPASDLGALLLHDPSDALLRSYREAAAWTGIDDDQVWEALRTRAWAWGARMAVSLSTAYAPTHGLGAAAQRLLSS